MEFNLFGTEERNRYEEMKRKRYPQDDIVSIGQRPLVELLNAEFEYNQSSVALDLRLNMHNDDIELFKKFINQSSDIDGCKITQKEDYNLICIIDDKYEFGVKRIETNFLDSREESKIFKTSIIIHTWNTDKTLKIYAISDNLKLEDKQGNSLYVDMYSKVPFRINQDPLVAKSNLNNQLKHYNNKIEELEKELELTKIKRKEIKGKLSVLES